MYLVDLKYISLLEARLERLKKSNRVYNFRCPICGDSQKSQRKRRGYLLFGNNNKPRYFCHNCGANLSFDSFLKRIAPDLYTQYKIDMFSEMYGSKNNRMNILINDSNKITETQKKLEFHLKKCKKLSEIEDSDKVLLQVLDYAKQRKIPEKYWNEIYASKSMNDVSQTIENYKDIKFFDAPCLVFPFFKKNGLFDYIQLRTVNNTEKFRFLTLQINEGIKIFGLNRINWFERVYVLESPIDSLFIDNSVAIAGANSSIDYIEEEILKRGEKSKICMLFDNDYKFNKNIMKRLRQSIENGYSVVIYDKRFPFKDINEAVMSGWSVDDINEYVRKRTFNGLRARLELGS